MSVPEANTQAGELLKSPEVVELPDIETLSLLAEGGPETSAAAFVRLEQYVPLKGRRFYGVYDANTGSYRVCTRLKDGDEDLDKILEPYTISGGLYAYRKLTGEHDELIKQIPGVFQELMSKYTTDTTRPSVEFYRRLDEFRLYLPIKR